VVSWLQKRWSEKLATAEYNKNDYIATRIQKAVVLGLSVQALREGGAVK
jgi:hypothetical protein